jgi:hypothetical protein
MTERQLREQTGLDPGIPSAGAETPGPSDELLGAADINTPTRVWYRCPSMSPNRNRPD